jgi:hypothetical protein
MRSNSDTSLKSARSYVTVTRLPPRFSQVFQPSDFKCELPRRCGSFPHCQPTAPCHSPDPIPPPLPRRSIASMASTVEVGKRSNNSIYRRQPSRIEDEAENHYNFIIWKSCCLCTGVRHCSHFVFEWCQRHIIFEYFTFMNNFCVV